MNEIQTAGIFLMSKMFPDGVMRCPKCQGYGGKVEVWRDAVVDVWCSKFVCPCGFNKTKAHVGDTPAIDMQISEDLKLEQFMK